jgi:phytoene dehydrogenase-like protein
MRDPRPVIVVGGGLAGLVAATLLARRGAAVRLFESASSLGGRAQTEEQDGFSFNLGPHALYASGEAARVLRLLGVEYQGHPPASTGLFASVAGELHVLPAAPASLL